MNWGLRFCRPLPYHLAMVPFYRQNLRRATFLSSGARQSFININSCLDTTCRALLCCDFAGIIYLVVQYCTGLRLLVDDARQSFMSK